MSVSSARKSSGKAGTPAASKNVEASRRAYYERISAYDMAPLWEVLKNLVPREPVTACAPAIWHFKDTRALVDEAGGLISAKEAEQIGLVNWVVPDDQLEAETLKVVDRLVNGPTVAYGLIKRLYHSSWDNSLPEQGMLEGELYGNYAMPSADAHEGLASFFEKRKPKFVGR